jgi:Glycosyl hydrolase family 76
MYMLTGNIKFAHQAINIYQWMKSSGIVSTVTWDVFDGVTAPKCTVATSGTYSYNYGMLAGALSYLCKATGEPMYFNDAVAILNRAKLLFTLNDTWNDLCEPDSCGLDSAKPKGTAMMGFLYLFMNTNDTAGKESIMETMDNSVLGMMPQCDNQGNCADSWSYAAKGAVTFHSQLNALSLMNAITYIHSSLDPNTKYLPPSQLAGNGSDSSNVSSAFKSVNWGLVCFALTSILLW